MTKLSVDSLAQEYEYDRSLGDMSEAVRIGNRPQFELNFDNRKYSVFVFLVFFCQAHTDIVIVGLLFRNIHPSLQYFSRSCIHTSLYDFCSSHVHPAL